TPTPRRPWHPSGSSSSGSGTPRRRGSPRNCGPSARTGRTCRRCRRRGGSTATAEPRPLPRRPDRTTAGRVRGLPSRTAAIARSPRGRRTPSRRKTRPRGTAGWRHRRGWLAARRNLQVHSGRLSIRTRSAVTIPEIVPSPNPPAGTSPMNRGSLTSRTPYSVLSTRYSVLIALTLLGANSSARAADPPKPLDRPIPAKDAPAAMTLPPGFDVTLFAGEPDIVQPIAMTFDDRGRLWVVECVSYPKWSLDGKGTDRVVILEDTDGDGRFDKKTVFLDNGVNLSGIEVGFGGVWLCSSPNLVFVPDRDGDDTPDGPPEVVLDGWNVKD